MSSTDVLYRTDLFLGKPENEKPFIATVPIGRASTPADVANTCCFLASDEAEFLTGNAVEVVSHLSSLVSPAAVSCWEQDMR